MRKLGVLLYAHFGVTMSAVARLCGVSVVAVLKWIRAAAETISVPKTVQSEVVQVDEMWHFINGKKTKFGSGERFVGHHVALSDGISAIVLMQV